jgi:hypothetical protein
MDTCVISVGIEEMSLAIGRLLCAICYLLDVAPERVDKLKRKII